jgi:hypothetical protein
MAERLGESVDHRVKLSDVEGFDVWHRYHPRHWLQVLHSRGPSVHPVAVQGRAWWQVGQGWVCSVVWPMAAQAAVGAAVIEGPATAPLVAPVAVTVGAVVLADIGAHRASSSQSGAQRAHR